MTKNQCKSVASAQSVAYVVITLMTRLAIMLVFKNALTRLVLLSVEFSAFGRRDNAVSFGFGFNFLDVALISTGVGRFFFSQFTALNAVFDAVVLIFLPSVNDGCCGLSECREREAESEKA